MLIESRKAFTVSEVEVTGGKQPEGLLAVIDSSLICSGSVQV